MSYTTSWRFVRFKFNMSKNRLDRDPFRCIYKHHTFAKCPEIVALKRNFLGRMPPRPPNAVKRCYELRPYNHNNYSAVFARLCTTRIDTSRAASINCRWSSSTRTWVSSFFHANWSGIRWQFSMWMLWSAGICKKCLLCACQFFSGNLIFARSNRFTFGRQEQSNTVRNAVVG